MELFIPIGSNIDFGLNVSLPTMIISLDVISSYGFFIEKAQNTNLDETKSLQDGAQVLRNGGINGK